ncbi:TIGR03086 family metal-binding protein [Actinoplanes aureus]|uniref:TIGR03086 family protein n=1 Tax=Actinoplanes aureus TaxID=2792083 RepID=A0A931FY82_9ACTN|nr:TIGR03086 family metal-binding protein [Actinoplanes aureus]MBG0564298.1 TIGR03086 family protein [Actinoplanes aureus]
MVKLNERALDLTEQVIEQVTDEELDRPTPCAGWRMEDLLRHLVSLNRGYAAAAEGEAAVWDDKDLGGDHRRAFRESAEAVRTAFRAPGYAERRVPVSRFGTFSGRTAAGLHLVEAVAHGWDIAVSIGAPYQPDDELVDVAYAVVARFPEGAGLRGPGAPFGEVVPVADAAPALDRLLGLVGRDPAWSPGGTVTP